MQIGELATQIGINASAIRYYESIGLLPKAPRQSGWRRYTKEDIKRLSVIHSARSVGFSIEDVGELLNDFPKTASPNKRWSLMAKKKLPELEKIIQETTALKYLIEAGLDCACDDIALCLNSQGYACRPKLHAAVISHRQVASANG